MRSHHAAAAIAVLTFGVVLLTNGSAADEKELRAALDKVVATMARNPDAVPKEGSALAKAQKIDNDSIKEVMAFLGERDAASPGWGVGKAGTIKPDGIEKKLRAIVQDKPPLSKATLAKEAPALVELAQRTAVIAVVAQASPPKKKVGDKDPKDWLEYSGDMFQASRELAKAAGADKPDLKAVKAAAAKLNASCSSCHGIFRD